MDGYRPFFSFLLAQAFVGYNRGRVGGWIRLRLALDGCFLRGIMARMEGFEWV